jgi:hypothetical protein
VANKPTWPTRPIFRRPPPVPVVNQKQVTAPNVVNFPGGESSYYPPDPRNPFSYLINQTAPILSYGGVLASTTVDVFPMVDTSGNLALYTFDPTQGFNDLNAPSQHFFRVETIAPYRVPTIRWVILTYTNLGLVTVTLNITACTDAQQIITRTQVCKIGSATNIDSVMSFRQSIEAFSGMNMQLSILRKAGAGPISVSRASLVGTVEETSY